MKHRVPASDTVLLVSFCPLDRLGGGEVYSLETWRALVAAGVTVTLCSPADALVPAADFRERMRSPFIVTRHDAGRLSTRAHEWGEILDLCAAHDLVWLHQFLAVDHTFDIIGATASDQRLLLTSLGLEPRRTIFSRLYQPSRRHAFIEISDYASERSGLFGANSHGVSAGIWAADIAPPGERNGHFCAVGRVLPHKGFEVTIDAMPAGLSLEVVGPVDRNSNYFSFLQTRTGEKNVTFRGSLAIGTRNETIRRSTALVASSTHHLHCGTVIEQPELLGLVLLESVALGTLPIASDVPAFREVMERLDLSTWVYPERDAVALSRLLERAGSLDEDERRSILDSAQEGLRRHFLWDDYWHRVSALFSRT